ncbi:hypothetical protein MPSEU_000794700 [Mayamaea pseudoterrestris]|nr:hypothetical protein MPSEU_000794700 [Mayamaea pseudoterrestris]
MTSSGPDQATLRVIAPAYLKEVARSKPDLLRRLDKLVHFLQTDERLEPDHLTATASSLLDYFNHKDKQVRLLALLASLEILAIFAPDCPYDEAEVLQVFRQLIPQLASLATVTDPNHDYFAQYERILILLAQVKIGVVLVEVAKHCAAADASRDDLDEADCIPSGKEAMELLAEFVQALLHCLRHDHPPIVLELAQKAIVAVLDEYDPQNVPIAVLDELLLCIGQGPSITITENAAAQGNGSASVGGSSKKVRSAKKGTPSSQASLLIQRKVPNPSYVCAAKVIQSTLNRLSTPIATLLNGLLNGDSQTIERSNISIEPPVTFANTADAAASTNHQDSVYTIIRQLFVLAPSILTTVIGTVSHGLVVHDEVTRLAATKLLGDLFAASHKKGTNSNLAADFRLVFKEWLGRRNDVSVSIRRCMVDCLVKILAAQAGETSASGEVVVTTGSNATTSHWTTRDDVTMTLVGMIKEDPDVSVRMEAIFAVCDWVYRSPSPVAIRASPGLLHAVGTRVSSKHKEERKNAMTGLAQIYFRQYLREKVASLVPIDGDATRDILDVSRVLEVLHEACHLRPGHRGSRQTKKRRHNNNNKKLDFGDDDVDDGDGYKDIDDETFGWIPSKIFECAYFTDAMDSDMRSRVVQVLDEVLLGSDTSSTSYKHLSVTARAVGFTMILNTISEGDFLMHYNEATQTNAFKYMRQLFGQRAALQKSLFKYLEARMAMKDLEHGSEDFYTAQANTLDLLEKVATLAPPAPGNDQAKVLEDFHKARDKHIFRQLALVVDPKQSNKVRFKALDDLPKRMKSAASDNASIWIKNLVRRCCMGDFMNASVAAECARLAHESFNEEDITACAAFLSSIKTIIDIFPTLGGVSETFSNLTDLFSSCRAIDDKDRKKDLAENGILTTLSSILAVAAPAPKASDNMDIEDDVNTTQLQEELMQLCTRDGTPEQARHAMYTLARVLLPKAAADEAHSSQSAKAKKQTLSHVISVLTAPNKLVIASSEKSLNLVRTMSALSALSDCASEVLLSSDRGQKAMKFALETLLMGRNRSDEAGEDESTAASTAEAKTPSSGRKQRSVGSSRKHITPEMASSLLEDENLSITCRTVCAAIDFLVCTIRSALLYSFQNKSDGLREQITPFIGKVFQQLIQMLRDQGLPPSESDRRRCNARQDRAALRQCASVHLFRLCDPRLGLESRYLDLTGWKCLADMLLGEERVVREACIEELSQMITGKGVYSSPNSRPASPALRFVSLVVFCSEGDASAACGNAAKIGKVSVTIKHSALACVANLRKVCDSYYNQCKANGREREFDTTKTGLMPEYMVPYAIHLLTHRRETPYAGGVVDADADPDNHKLADDEAQNKVLRKRLRILLEPLILSLGENADNISFLLRMTEMLGKNFRPVDIAPGFHRGSGNCTSLHLIDLKTSEAETAENKRDIVLEAKLKSVATAAREVLLGFVKKDTNLNQYPGSILLPSFLFKKIHSKSRRSDRRTESVTLSSQDTASSHSHSMKTTSPLQTKRKRDLSPAARTSTNEKSPSQALESVPDESMGINDASPLSSKKRNVHFSPDVQFKPGSAAHQSMLSAETGSEHFGDMSPIAQSGSPASSNTESPSHGSRRSTRLSCSIPTLGTTPPSILRGSTMPSTTPRTSSSRKSLLEGTSGVQEQSQVLPPHSLPPKISSEDTASAEDEDIALSFGQPDLAISQEGNKKRKVIAGEKPPRDNRRAPTRVSKPATLSQDDSFQEEIATRKRGTLKSRKTTKGVPTQIKINHAEMLPSSMDSDQPTGARKIAKKRGSRSSKSDYSDLDFDFENTGNRTSKPTIVKKPKTNSAASSRTTKSRR